MDSVLVLKAASIERCLKRIAEDYGNDFAVDLTKQDAVILNLQRTCQLAIDMAGHIVRVKKMGVPDSFTGSFKLLQKAEIISESLARRMESMIGFRNIAIHEYQELDLEIVEGIINSRLGAFREFTELVLKMS